MLSWVVHADGDAYTRACVLAALDELGLIIAFVTFAEHKETEATSMGQRQSV